VWARSHAYDKLMLCCIDSLAYLGTGFMVALTDGRGRICRLCPVWFFAFILGDSTHRSLFYFFSL
jgi:hypothetical protein